MRTCSNVYANGGHFSLPGSPFFPPLGARCGSNESSTSYQVTFNTLWRNPHKENVEARGNWLDHRLCFLLDYE